MGFISGKIQSRISENSNEHFIKSPCYKFLVYTKTSEIPKSVNSPFDFP